MVRFGDGSLGDEVSEIDVAKVSEDRYSECVVYLDESCFGSG